MAIPTPPAAPNPLGTNFAAEALAFTQWMQTAAPEFNTAVGDANQAVLDAQTEGGAAVLAAESARDAAQGHATDSDTARGLAVTAQGLAEDARDAAQGFAGGAEDARDMAQTYAAAAGAAAGLPALAGQALKNLRVKTDETGVEWTAEAAPGSMARTEKTSAYTLAGADKGALIDCSGTWTLGLTAAATLGAGRWCYVRNIGTSTITADPNGSELIDGVTSGAIRPGMTLLIQCDGTAFHCVRVGPHVAMEVLTSGTSWTCPLGVRVARFRLTNGGSAGGIGSGSFSGSGGRGGSTSEFVAALTPGTAYTYAVGAAAGTTSITIAGTTYTGTSVPGGSGRVIPGLVYHAGWAPTGASQPGGQTVTGFGQGGDGATSPGPAEAGYPGGIILEY